MLSLVVVLGLAAPAFAADAVALGPAHATANQPAHLALIATGHRTLMALQADLHTIDDVHVLRACYEILDESFEEDARASEIRAVPPADANDRARYEAASRLGDLKAESALPGLRRILDRPFEPLRLRVAAAKSLAQLGELRGLPLLFENAASNDSSDRRLANIGLKAISGKDLGDFGGFDFGERRFTLGVGAHTIKFVEEPVVLSENRAKRHASAAAYARWLKADRPTLYAILSADR